MLKVSARATPLLVRRAFKRLALKHHPDRHANDPRAAQLFIRLCLAYDVLTGARPAAPSPPSPATGATDPGAGRAWTPPWVTRPAPPEPLPTEWEDGTPIHYPSTEDIARLNVKDPFPKNQKLGGFAVIAVALVLSVLWVLEGLSDEPAAELDPVRKALRESLGRLRP